MGIRNALGRFFRKKRNPNLGQEAKLTAEHSAHAGRDPNLGQKVSLTAKHSAPATGSKVVLTPEEAAKIRKQALREEEN
ncbi:MAG: hypothetical protein CL944_01840 [Candidatus Diapherotrites archaeon]|uniref:Uncharacterized protein n=1 Tax=Candidatus Iainarchaeum sp. TaxID=3101447 RepID=A0A2D6LPT7_9ARCH|nr:hypothetical protein [Candidatus Diapherotrites archaeon]|tara:strand:+ start:3614 stop:3850 length:237 start_codon:yes stop_codon:yes gene_type:complete